MFVTVILAMLPMVLPVPVALITKRLEIAFRNSSSISFAAFAASSKAEVGVAG